MGAAGARGPRALAGTSARDACLPRPRREQDWGAAERYLRRVVSLDPLREAAQRALMQTLARAGTPAAALQCFRDLRLLLARELKAEPAPETTALFRQIRADAQRQLQTSPPHTTAPPSPAVLVTFHVPGPHFSGVSRRSMTSRPAWSRRGS